MPSFEAIRDVLGSLAAAAAIGISVFGLGRPALRRLNLPHNDPLFVGVWSMALGLVIGGSLLLVLAAAGCVYSSVIAGMTLAACFWSLVEFACIYLGAAVGRIVDPVSALAPGRAPPPRPRVTVLLALLAAVVLLPSLIVALAPTTSPEALSASLELPKELLLDHGFSASQLIGPAPPGLVQMWYLWALALNGPVAAALVHWGLGVLLALATVLLARAFLPARHTWLAGGLVLLCPGVQHQLSLPLADLGLALFCSLALAAVGQIVLHLEISRWPIAAGVMLGGAVAAMPAGLAFSEALGVVFAWVAAAQGESRREFWQAARTLLLACLVTAAPWLFFLGFSLNQPGPTQSIRSVVTHLGPLLLLAVGMLPATRRLRGLSLVIGVSSVFFVLAQYSPWPGRWWSPLVPPAGVVAVWVWRDTVQRTRAVSGIVSTAVVILALAVPVAGWRTAGNYLAVATGWQHRDDFLLTREPTYRAARMLNRIQNSSDRLLYQDSTGGGVASTFYFNCPAARQVGAADWLSWSSAARNDAALTDAASASGFTYVLVAEPAGFARGAATDRGLSTPDASAAAGSNDEVGPIGEVIPILEYRFADDNNRPIRYRLLRLAKCRR